MMGVSIKSYALSWLFIYSCKILVVSLIASVALWQSGPLLYSGFFEVFIWLFIYGLSLFPMVWIGGSFAPSNLAGLVVTLIYFLSILIDYTVSDPLQSLPIKATASLLP